MRLRSLLIVSLSSLVISGCGKDINIKPGDICKVLQCPQPSPSPTITPAPSPIPSAQPSPIPTPEPPQPSPSPVPTASPTPTPSPITLCKDPRDEKDCHSCTDFKNSSIKFGHWVLAGTATDGRTIYMNDDPVSVRPKEYTDDRCNTVTAPPEANIIHGPDRLGVCRPLIPCTVPPPSPQSRCNPVCFLGGGGHSAQDQFHQGVPIRTLDTPVGKLVKGVPVGGLFRLDTTARYGNCGTRGVADREDCDSTNTCCSDPRGPVWEVIETPSGTYCTVENPGDNGRGYFMRCGNLSKQDPNGVQRGRHAFKACITNPWVSDTKPPENVFVCGSNTGDKVCSPIIEVYPGE